MSKRRVFSFRKTLEGEMRAKGDNFDALALPNTFRVEVKQQLIAKLAQDGRRLVGEPRIEINEETQIALVSYNYE